MRFPLSPDRNLIKDSGFRCSYRVGDPSNDERVGGERWSILDFLEQKKTLCMPVCRG